MKLPEYHTGEFQRNKSQHGHAITTNNVMAMTVTTNTFTTLLLLLLHLLQTLL